MPSVEPDELRPVLCENCGRRFTVREIGDADCLTLLNAHSDRKLEEELRMLLKVKEYFDRTPGAEEEHHQRRIDVLRFPPNRDGESRPESGKRNAPSLDDEVTEYLSNHFFKLEVRLKFVSEEISKREGSVRDVFCKLCETGRLTVPTEDWDAFVEFRSTSWVWPNWHRFDDDGMLHLKWTGWRADGHMTGEQAVERENAEYEFWCWLVAQPQHARLVNTDELPALKEEFARERGGNGGE